jgi:hypothetical protein
MKKRDAMLWLASLAVGSVVVLPLWWRGATMNPRDLILLSGTRSSP